MDAFDLVPGGEIALLEPGVAFDLVGRGHDGGVGEEPFEFGAAEIGDADGFRFAALLQSVFHSFPRIDVVRVAWFHLAVVLFISGHQDVAAGEGGGPVHEVEV